MAIQSHILQTEDGDYVLYWDYQKLEAGNETLKVAERVQDSLIHKIALALGYSDDSWYTGNAIVEKVTELRAYKEACEKQEPVAWITEWEGSKSLSFHFPKIGALSHALYHRPSPATIEKAKLKSAVTAIVGAALDSGYNGNPSHFAEVVTGILEKEFTIIKGDTK